MTRLDDAFPTAERQKDFRALVDFAAQSRVETGFGYLLSNGVVDDKRPVELWITCRMTHVFSLAHLLGFDGARKLAAHGVHCLERGFEDPRYGGWFSAIEHSFGTDGRGVPVDDGKAAYAHAFVILAASSASIADIAGARELLDRALANQEEYWWESEAGKVRESFDRAFSHPEDYRGVNANMHTTEAYLAAFDATDDITWLERALGILTWVIDQQARSMGWRVPEHFDAQWNVLPNYNIDKPKDPFRPYGFTPGHAFEWARLAIHAGAQLHRIGRNIPEWIQPAARALVAQAAVDGWRADGADGFVYTVDSQGQPITGERMHWVLCEALGAAATLARMLAGKDGYEAVADNAFRAQLEESMGQWWAWAKEKLIEYPGQWFHELDTDNRPSTVTWPGKPDAYHIAQMHLLPDLPLAPTFARAVRDGGIWQ
ncbi:MAG: AGE family epimerase/isomerase [Actinomycetaceae bacterium]|nr:AGE family epimerase/isomerase [Actinomycetaceae bacterium]